MQSQPVHKCLLCEQFLHPGDRDSCGQRSPGLRVSKWYLWSPSAPSSNHPGEARPHLEPGLFPAVGTTKGPPISLGLSRQSRKTLFSLLNLSPTAWLTSWRKASFASHSDENRHANREAFLNPPHSKFGYLTSRQVQEHAHTHMHTIVHTHIRTQSCTHTYAHNHTHTNSATYMHRISLICVTCTVVN